MGYVTLSGSDLLVAYLAGKRLTSTQALTISVLFVFAAFMGIRSTSAYLARADALELMQTYRSYGAQHHMRYGAAIIMSLGVIACLKFMWDVHRHQNRTPERPLTG